MRRRRGKRGKYTVSDTAIRREIHKAQKKLRVKRRKAPPEKKKHIDLALKMLRKCDVLLDDILCF